MRTRAAEVGTSIAARSEHGLVRAEAVECAVLHVEGDHANTLAILHDEVEREVLDEEVGVVSEGLTIEGMKNGVPGSVGCGCTTVCLSTLPELQRLTTECALVDLALLRPRERNTVVLELKHSQQP